MWKRRPSSGRWRAVTLLGIAILCGAARAEAHPHALVAYSIVLPLSSEGLEHVGFVFTFDPLFSAIILRNMSPADPAAESGYHERSLRQIPFEIDIAFNGTPVALDSPTDLRVSTAGGQLTYRFAVPLRDRLLPPGTIDIVVDDPGMFTAFVLRATTPVEIEAAGPYHASCHRARTPTGAPGPVRCQYVDSSGAADMRQ
jgi:ABC-type uncharacterized transport system substrate-binding protein